MPTRERGGGSGGEIIRVEDSDMREIERDSGVGVTYGILGRGKEVEGEVNKIFSNKGNN